VTDISGDGIDISVISFIRISEIRVKEEGIRDKKSLVKIRQN
jgi:hypothetical protein